MNASTSRALVVDDDQVYREFVREAFAEDRFGDLDEASTFQEAIDRIQADDYGLIVLDYRLPDGDGVELLEEMQGRGLDVPVIMMTGQGDEQVAVQAMKAGADDYLTKDQLTETRLVQTAENVVAARRAEAEVDRLTDALATRERVALLGELSEDAVEGLVHVGEELEHLFDDVRPWIPDDDPDAVETEQEIDDVLASMQQMVGVVASFRHLLTAGPQPDRIDVPEVVSATGSDAQRMTRPGVTLSVETDVDAATRIDPRALRYVLHQLINNASEAMREDGQITLRVEADGSEVRVVVEDEGPGFPPEVEDRASELHVTTKENHDGVGLTVARHLVEVHGGEIRGGDRPGGGARVVVALPRDDA